MKSSVARRADLAAALKRFRKDETISLEDLARLWGVTKARFINMRADIADFPEMVGKQGNAHLFVARPALTALLKHEGRNDAAIGAKSAKVARILGVQSASDVDDQLSAVEMLQLARAGAEVDRRKREQGLLVTAVEVQQVSGEVFSSISGTLGKLSDNVDPNGRLPGAVRATLDQLGKDLLLRMYADLRDMLGGDAEPQHSRDEAPRGRARTARNTGARRKRA